MRVHQGAESGQIHARHVGEARHHVARHIGDNEGMSHWDDAVNHHAAELTRLTMKAADELLPENELAQLGKVIATERHLLIEAIGQVLEVEEPEVVGKPGVAEFDAGFVYGMSFAQAIADTKAALDRIRRGRILKLVWNSERAAGHGA
jgi:hypothetical protein